MLKLGYVCFVLLALSLPAPAGAVGKITTDPNAGVRTRDTSDLSIAGKVTYEAKRKTVTVVLADLSKATGVVLKAGYNSEDWRVRDRRMDIFVRDIPLSDLMGSIARVMKYRWIKSETNSVTGYRLIADRKALSDAQRLLATQDGDLRKHQLEGRQRLLSDLEEASKPDTDLEKLKEQSSYVYDATAKGWGKLLAHVLGEVPSARKAFLSGDPYFMDYETMSPETRRALFDFIETDNPTGGCIAISGLQACRFQSMHVGVAGLYDADSPLIAPSTSCGMGYVAAEVSRGEMSSFSSLSINDPKSDMAELSTKFFQVLGRKDRGEIDQLMNKIARARETEGIDPVEQTAQHPDDPALSVKVKLKLEGDKLADALAALAKSSDFAIVSDDSNAKLTRSNVPADEIEISAVLDKVARVCHYNWEKRGCTLELRDRDWLRKLDTLVPEARLEAWRKALKEKGTLDLDELAQISLLTREQRHVNIWEDDVLRNASGAISGNDDILHLYASLTSPQRAMVLSEQGLSKKQGLDLDALANYSDGLTIDHGTRARRRALQTASAEESRLIGTCIRNANQTLYTFSITASSRDTAIARWSITCPVYTPPAADKPKDGKPTVTPLGRG